jgi:uncharacterized protein (DUF362 family)/Pyruvate/2-oxoacid:ferredoxin oxidoreductase delta subunit
MIKSKVAVIRCDQYDEQQVFNAIKRGLDLIGGLSSFVRTGERIVLKPNVLVGSDPQRCVCTNPAVLKAAGKLLQMEGVIVSCGDSPGYFLKCEPNLQRAGLKKAADALGIRIADFDEGKPVTLKDPLLNSRFVIANGVLEADGVISLPKLKTHQLTRFTGAIKNQFGCIPGMLKGQYHVKMPDPFTFATMLVDLNSLIRPRLFIMDGIMAMEGNGPFSGKPRRMNVLLLSSDPVALDSVACKIIDLNPEFVPTSKPGEKSGLGTYHYEQIEILGDDVNSFITRDFDVVRKPPIAAASGRIRNFFKNQTFPGPAIDKNKCTKCGTCFKVCPLKPKAIAWEKGLIPKHNYNHCIRCYCCQELCPEGAISIKNTLFGRAVFGKL